MQKSKPAHKVFSAEKGLRSNPSEIRGEEEPVLEFETCPTCGMDKSDWKGHRGKGYKQAGETYCCQECADGSGCTCEEEALSE